MIAIVTGQERNSDFIIAALFAVLKSLQMPGEPVSETATEGVPAAFSFDLSASAAATIAVGSPFAPAVTTAVWPSGETLAPGTWPLHGGDALVPGETALDAADRPLELGCGGRHRRGVDDDGQRRARKPGEVPLDQRPGLHRLGAVRLPAGAGQGRLDLRCEGREGDGDDRPHDQNRAHVVGGEAAEPADRADSKVLAGRRAGTGRYRDRRHLQPPSIPIEPSVAAERWSRSDAE